MNFSPPLIFLPFLSCIVKSGDTPLLAAFDAGHLDIVSLLLDRGADVIYQNHVSQ